MKSTLVYLLGIAVILSLMNACGPSEQEQQQQRQQARMDSLQQVRRQQQQQRLDSLRRAKAEAEKRAEEQQQEEQQEPPQNEIQVQFNPNGNLALQVEAWRSREKAEAQVSKWRDRGFPNAYVVKHGNEATGNIWFRVRLGRVGSMEMAQRLGARLQQQYGERYWIANARGEGTAPDATSR